MINAKGKTNDQILAEYADLRKYKLKKIERIQKLIKSDVGPSPYDKNVQGLSEGEHHREFQARLAARLAKQEESLKFIDEEIARRK